MDKELLDEFENILKKEFKSIPFTIFSSVSSYGINSLKFKIEEGQSQILLDKVNEGDLDMAILALPYDTKDLTTFKFWEEDFFWVSNTQDKNAGKTEIKASELENADLLLLEDGHCLKDHILGACNFSSSSKYSLKASSLNTIIQLVKGRMGTTLIPKMALKELIGSKKDFFIAHLNEPGPHREIALVTRPDYAGMENMNLLIDFFEQCLRQSNRN